MGKRRNLNQDYYKLSGRTMIKSPPDEALVKVYKVVHGNIKKPLTGRTDIGEEKI